MTKKNKTKTSRQQLTKKTTASLTKTSTTTTTTSSSMDEIQKRRLQQLQAHLNPPTSREPITTATPVLTQNVMTHSNNDNQKTVEEKSVNNNHLRECTLNSSMTRSYQEQVYEAMRECPKLFTHDTNDLQRSDLLDITFKRMVYLCREKKLFRCQDLFHNYEAHSAKLAAVMNFDESLYLKLALTFNFFAGSLYHLGTPSKSFYGTEEFWNRINNLEIMGCFAITELSHGSNVAAIETSAVLDPVTREFIIHSPRKQSMKWWIGNTAHAHMCITFAQLYISGVCYGVHAFIVPIRNIDTNEIAPGVVIGDCGPKIGCNGLDNGCILFNNVRIPLSHMLDRLATVSVNESSVPIYTSPISSSAKRFGSMLAQLTMGRCALVGVSAGTYAMALRAAVPYAFTRTQFGAASRQNDGDLGDNNKSKKQENTKDGNNSGPTPSKPEMTNEELVRQRIQINDQDELPVITFQEQKLKLYPLLAEAYAFQFAAKHVLKLYSTTMGVSGVPVPTKSKQRNSQVSKSESNGQSPSKVEQKKSSEHKRQELHVATAGLKAYCSDQTMKALSILRASCGGHGYAAWNRFGDWRNIIDVTRTFEGDNTVLYQQVAKQLMQDYQSRYANCNFITSGLYYSGDQLSEYFKSTQLSQYGGNVRDEWYLGSLLEYRVQRLVHTVTLRYQNILKQLNDASDREPEPKQPIAAIRAKNGFLAWNHVQNHLIQASKAAVERDLFKYFVKGARSFSKTYPKETENYELLKHMYTLYALSVIQSDSGWFLRHCMNDAAAKQVQKHIIALCEELSYEQVIALLEPISPPDDIIDIPLSLQLTTPWESAQSDEIKGEKWSKAYMKDTFYRSLKFQQFGNAYLHQQFDNWI